MTDRPPLDLPWSNRPPKASLADRWDIRRCRATEKVRAIILSHQVVGLYVHYWSGRSRPCTGETCEACASNNAARWKGYLAATDEGLKARWLLELNASCAQGAHVHFSKLRTLRGCLAILSRSNGKSNGPLFLQISNQPMPNHALPDAPNVEQKLCRIWEVHYTAAPRPLLDIKRDDDEALGVVG